MHVGFDVPLQKPSETSAKLKKNENAKQWGIKYVNMHILNDA